MLRGYMHGFLISYKLYSKLRSLATPFDYLQYEKTRISDKILKINENRIIMEKVAPKVNRAFADQLKLSKSANKKKVYYIYIYIFIYI